jgi:1-aminocyclopropane-1-carboxylate deaminase/D-cysteine desulfhydrase-like pyridoxal-dependent ACC family enzyme
MNLKRFSRHLYKKVLFEIQYIRRFSARTSKFMEVNVDLAQWNQG